jgi:hypothetical protein
MKIIESFGKEELAIVHAGETSRASWVEFVESLQPRFHAKRSGF